MLITDINKLENFYSAKRKWQGIPGIERTKNGRLFATFYSGGKTEQPGNYCVLLKSDDDGANWSEPIAAAYSGNRYRAYDPCLWTDPHGRLWFIWAVMPGHHVEYSICCDPDAASLEWTAPKPFANDVMMNKPTVLSSGEWLFPCAVWGEGIYVINKKYETGNSPRLAFAYRTADKGQTFERLGGVSMPRRHFDEHQILEMNDGSLLMFVRTFYGIGKSISRDKGVTWSGGEDSGLGGPDSRFFIRRLSSGNILLINHHSNKGRNNLKAMISRDECKTWEGFLMIDERSAVSYPDAVEAGNGYIYAVYDRDRCGSGEILMAKFTEKDVLQGSVSSGEGRLRANVSSLII
ncbi:MAG: sialidase family protein [Eubacteriales bacterium]|nr:sialidase family protein [Eubacteriales bacterium]